MKKDLKYYMSLPYKVEIFPSPEGGYAARVTDLPGCITCAETWDELLFMIEDAKNAGWKTLWSMVCSFPNRPKHQQKKSHSTSSKCYLPVSNTDGFCCNNHNYKQTQGRHGNVRLSLAATGNESLVKRFTGANIR